MASNKATGKVVGKAIDPRTFGGSRGLAIVPSGAVQQVAFATAANTSDKAGLAIDALRVRLLAAGAPLWARTYNAGDFAFMVGRAPAGKVGVALHAYRHDTPKGQKTACVGGHGVAGTACASTAPSAGDNVRRYRTDSAYGAPTLDNVGECLRLATTRLGECCANLAARGASVADMLATPSIAWYAAQGAAFANVVQGKASRKASASTPRRAAAKVAAPAPEVEPVAASAD